MFSALLAGCGMAGPGVASLQPSGAYHEEVTQDTLYNNDWTNGPQATSVDSLDADRPLSVDISERELGVTTLDEETRIGQKKRREPAHLKRQRERREARRAVWRERMGITNIKDEQED